MGSPSKIANNKTSYRSLMSIAIWAGSLQSNACTKITCCYSSMVQDTVPGVVVMMAASKEIAVGWVKVSGTGTQVG